MSEWCHMLFKQYNGLNYERFHREVIMSSSELDANVYKTRFDSTKRPLIIGNWSGFNKGNTIVSRLAGALPEFKFENLGIPTNLNVLEHNKRKVERYASADMYLCLSLSEGFPYSVADAFQTNLIVVTTDVGFVPDTDIKEEEYICKVIKREKLGDIEYLAGVIRDVWSKKEKYFGNSRKWFTKNCLPCLFLAWF